MISKDEPDHQLPFHYQLDQAGIGDANNCIGDGLHLYICWWIKSVGTFKGLPVDRLDSGHPLAHFCFRLEGFDPEAPPLFYFFGDSADPFGDGVVPRQIS